MFGRMCLLTLILFSTTVPGALAHDQESHGSPKVPTLNKSLTSVTLEPNTVTVTFGPIDLPVHHSGDLAASMPKHFFNLPKTAV